MSFNYIGANKTKLFGVGIVALMLCLFLSQDISDFVYRNFVQYHNITINVTDILDNGINSPRLVDNYYEAVDVDGVPNIVNDKKYGFYNFERLKRSIVESNDIKIIEPDLSEYGYGYIEFSAINSYVVLKLPVYQNTCLTLTCDNNLYALNIKDNDGIYERPVGALEKDYYDAGWLKIYPFSESGSTYILIYTIIVYILAYCVIYSILLCADKLFEYILCKSSFLSCNINNIYMFIIIFLLYTVFTSVTYYLNWEKLQVGEMADAYYYMHPQVWDENDRFSIAVTARYLYSFRGYFPIVVSLVANSLAYRLSIDVMYLYFIYYGIIVAFTISIAVPKLYEGLTNKKTTNIMCIAMFLLFALSWFNFFYYALTDIPAAMAAICAISYMISFLEYRKKKDIFFAGFLIGFAISYRCAYTYVFYMMLVWIIVDVIVRKVKKNGGKVFTLKEIGTAFIILFCGIMIICWPQFVLNLERDHFGMFPYNAPLGYDMNSREDLEAVWADFTSGLHSYTFMGAQNGDRQLGNIDQYYYMDKYYSFRDLLYIVLNNPIEFLMGYFKRLFWAVSVGIEGVYGTISVPSWMYDVLDMIHYVWIGNVFYLLFSKKMIEYCNCKMQFLSAALAVSTIFIQNLTHIEKRYFLVFQLFIYFLNAFVLLDYVKEMKSNQRSTSIKHIIITFLFIFGCYTAKQTISLNFL